MTPNATGPAPHSQSSTGSEARETTRTQDHNTESPPVLQDGFCSGYGQWHSPNNQTDPRPYATINMAQIKEMAADPPSVEKDQAQWCIFSTMLSRVHSKQREQGQFYALWADIDEPDGLTFDDILDRVELILPAFIAFTTRSATQDRQKARIIAGLAAPVSGAEFILLQKIFNDKLQAAGITPDRATERAGQVCYLPNRGEFYSYAIDKGTPLNASAWADDVAAEQQRQQAEEQAKKARREQAKLKAAQRVASGGESPIEAFNAAYDLPLMLDACGYVERGRKWLSPNSESGVPGVTITTDGRKWMSAHGSDAMIGTKTSNGTLGDSFDLFTHYQHHGDRDRAIKAAAVMFGCKSIVGISDNNPPPEPTNNDEPVAAVDLFGNMEQPPFPVDLFPPVVADFAKDQAELMGVDPAIICMAALGALAGCIDDRLQIQPKRFDPTWRESARLWIGIIGDPSTKKSPGMKKAISPVNRVAAEWRKKHAEAVKQWEDECEKLKANDKKAKLPPKPAAKRLTVSDSTVEKLGEILAGMEPRGILVDRDELTGWLNSMDAYKNGGGKDRAAWLEAYNGGGQEVDRIQRGSLWVPNWSACVVGGIQPQVIQGYAKVTNHDGMLQRFILVHAAPAKPGIDRHPDMEAKMAYSDLVEQLACLQPTDEPVKLSDGAHAVREAFNDKLHRATISLPNPHLAAMLGKWEGTFARVLLTLHVAECAARREYPTEKQVPEQTARNVAALLWKVLLPHAIRFYDGLDATESHAKSLAGLLLARGWERFTVKRDLHNNMVAFRKMMEWEREEMLDRLAAYGWIFPEQGKINERGKPSAYLVNPDIHRRFTGQAEREKQRRAEVAKITADLR